jgi:hypothetical protein
MTGTSLIMSVINFIESYVFKDVPPITIYDGMLTAFFLYVS